MEIKDAVAVVTGGASGLGLATTKRLLDAGAQVVVLDLRGEDAVRELGDRARFAQTDVTDEAAVASALDTAETLGTLRIVVNCAGTGNAIRVLSRDGVFPLDAFRKIVEINLVGTFNVLRLAAARIAETEPIGEERGVIINTASVAAFDGQIGQAAYSASKGGVVGMTLPIARDLAGKAIRVVTIAPGLFDTPLLAGLPEPAREPLGKQVPHPSRLGNPDEYGALAVNIIENPMLNGEVIRLDGANRLAPRCRARYNRKPPAMGGAGIWKLRRDYRRNHRLTAGSAISSRASMLMFLPQLAVWSGCQSSNCSEVSPSTSTSPW